MVIVEGVDGSGKSTLILSLQEQFRIPAIRSGMRGAQLTQMTHYHNWCLAAPSPLILDRHPLISGLIYGRTLDGQTESTAAIAHAYRQEHFLIFCNPSLSAVERTVRHMPQMDGVLPHLTDLYRAYTDLMDILEPDFVYDFTKPNALPALITHLTHYLAKHHP